MAVGSKITNNGVKIIMSNAFETAPTYTRASKLKVGIGTTTPTISDTDLENPVPITGTEQVDDCETADWTDDAECTTTLNTTTYKENVSSLNIAKDGGSAAVCETHKTTTSLDFTSKDLNMWLYIKDATALAKLVATGTPACSIRFGSSSAAYYEWEYDITDLAVGWNRLDGMNVASADNTVGTPTLGAMDYSYIEFEATGAAVVWSAGDFIMDDWKLVSTGDYLEDFESGYPSINYTKKEVTIRTRLASTEANGYLISEQGLFNTDTTRLMMTHNVFTSFSKSATDELIFSEVFEFDNTQ